MRRRFGSGSGLTVPACFILGVALGYAWFFLHWPFWAVGLFLLPAIALLKLGRFVAAVSLFAGLLGCSLALQWQLDDRYTSFTPGELIAIHGRIVGLPENLGNYTRFRFQPSKSRDSRPAPTSATADLPDEILVHWYRNAPELLPGQVWQLQVQLKPPWGLVNFQGQDKERWLFAEGIGGQATVRQGQLFSEGNWFGQLDRLRWRLSQAMAAVESTADSLGITRALAVADRTGLTKEQRNSLSVTGTAHLLAISGLHVGLAYLLAFGLARLLLLPLSSRLPNSRIACLVFGWVGACAYAGLAGFSTSTIRALVMLSVVLCLQLAKRNIPPMHSLILALTVVLLTEMLAPLQAGAWMSFVAVAALLLWFVPRRGHGSGWLKSMLQAQFAVMLLCFPFTAWWFQMSSPAGFLANLVAIPWVSFIVVPLVLLALIVWPFEPALFGWLVNTAAHASDWLMLLLKPLAGSVQAYSSILQPSWLSLSMAVVAAGLMLLPRGLRLQAPALLLMLPLLLPAQPAAANKLQLDVLDVGQGTALLLQTGANLLLYDSGPGDGLGNDLVGSVIHPAILASGYARPDRIIISHGDLDHAGGLASLLEQYPAVPLFASLPQQVPGIDACDDSLSWSWQQSQFRVLHPSPFLPYQGNDSSCVLDINAGQFKILLTGDISSKVERRLLGRKLDIYRILLVPHHGSRSSSDPELLRVTVPELAIATAGVGNRFGFPRPEVKQRYRDAGIKLLSTDQCGAIRLEINGDGPAELQSARRQRRAPWRWPAGPECP
ncbi:MAG: DNA internalization-related competence protein ComEC/Rec2 [Xanthomonadales bacterium]|nr:DNA internalization-related competence protein ComEC/Rec2 [Xanthomonadales bacterium]